MNKYQFKLFITGRSARAEKAIRSIRQLIKDNPSTEFHLDVVDVLETPDIAEKEKVLATPTLIKQIPPPVKRIVGDLSNTEKIKQYLEIL